MPHRIIISTWLLGLIVQPAAIGQEWTRFRGPNGSGECEATTIPERWTEDDYNWQAALLGVGHSSPVVWGPRLFLLSADPETATRYVLCLSTRNGSTLWQREFAAQPYPIHVRNSFASTTPAVDQDHVYVAWATPERLTLMALSHSGETVWSQDDLGRYESMHGFGGSPMLYKDLVILCNEQEKPAEASSIMAFDRHTGQLRWTRPRTLTTTSYAVPCIRHTESGGDELICCSTAHGIFSLDPQTGQQRWSIDVFTMRTVSSPLLVGDLIFGSTGSGQGGNYVVAVRPGDKPEVAYKVEQPAPYVPTPVARGDMVFLWGDSGVVSCLDAATGHVHWRQRVGGNYSGSPVRVGGRLYCISERGEVVVVAAEKDYRLISRNPLGEDSRSTPAVADGRMYLRTYSHLFSIGGG
jgi:outer membrane protein assembly factor BamB